MEYEVHARIVVKDDLADLSMEKLIPSSDQLLRSSLPKVLEGNYETFIDIRSAMQNASLKGKRECCVRVDTKSFYEIRSLIESYGYQTIVSYVDDGISSDVKIKW